ncbi:MAG: hypothetical protein A2W25_07170 [candidate division Zixibacteria bacterium RBG_16_53_22]|nr:MAG: hypothetical protein A2W25_07170 [candidate division Zixibacteria bacterium RBG_16_53_22]
MNGAADIFHPPQTISNIDAPDSRPQFGDALAGTWLLQYVAKPMMLNIIAMIMCRRQFGKMRRAISIDQR